MPEQLTPLSVEELTAIRDYYTAQIIPGCPVRGDELIIDRVLQMLDEHTRLGATVRALEARIAESEGRRCGNCAHGYSPVQGWVRCNIYPPTRLANRLCECWEASNSGDEELYLPPPTRSKPIKIKIVEKRVRPPVVIEESTDD